MKSLIVKFNIKYIAAFLCLILGFAVISASYNSRALSAYVPAERSLPIYSVDRSDKVISLGINCAWGDEDVPKFLEILEKNNVKATFFVTGTFCRKFPLAVKAIYDAGHEIGSHSNTHVDLTKLGNQELLDQIRKGSAEIIAITGEAPKLFRTPSGAYNSTVIDTIVSEGIMPIQWSCDSIDYKDPTIEQMQERILSKLSSGEITLFHVGAKNTPAALEKIIPAIKEKGYNIVKVGDIIYTQDYEMDFEGKQHLKK